MRRFGKAFHRTIPWIPLSVAQPIYLQMDNAGGHGMKEEIYEYTQLIQQQLKIGVFAVRQRRIRLTSAAGEDEGRRHQQLK